MTNLNASRRQFLRTASVVLRLGRRRRRAVRAEPRDARLGRRADRRPDYKALVCLFLYGGNDASNMVLRTDATSFNVYTAMRTPGADSIALLAARHRRRTRTPRRGHAGAPRRRRCRSRRSSPPACRADREQRVHLRPASEHDGGRRACSPRVASPILANAGPLVAPMTKAAVPAEQRAAAAHARLAQRPAVDLAGARPRRREGRLGRPPRRPGREQQHERRPFTSISVVRQRRVLGRRHGVPVPGRRQRRGPDRRASPAPVRLDDRGGDAAASIVTGDNENLFANEYASIIKPLDHGAGDLPDRLHRVDGARRRPTYIEPSTGQPQNNGLAQQLQTVARMIGARTALGVKRQIFFVSMGGFDTHDNQNTSQADLLARLSHAIGYFDTAMSTIGGVDMRNNVTLFTASDFGRTLTSNGDGTDHGWGGAPLRAGGAVNGGEIYGRFPQFGSRKQDSAGNAVPAGHLGRPDRRDARQMVRRQRHRSLNTIFPNLTNFHSATSASLR